MMSGGLSRGRPDSPVPPLTPVPEEAEEGLKMA
jgi:hypothetical protein